MGLIHQRRLELSDREHFYSFSAQVMRFILIDHARARKSGKRGGASPHVPLHEEMKWVSIECIQIALIGTHCFTKATLPCMMEQCKGSIVDIVSIQAMAGMMTPDASTATKAALLGGVGYPRDVDYAALFPAPDEASFPAGVTLPVEGGWTSK